MSSMGRHWRQQDELKARMHEASAGDIYPAYTRMRLAFYSSGEYRQRKAADVWRLAIARVAAGADLKTLLYALADGVTLGPHGTPWR